jgi:hypothetical protein
MNAIGGKAVVAVGTVVVAAGWVFKQVTDKVSCQQHSAVDAEGIHLQQHS